jgi:S1-C subfamily serine protease
LKGELLNTATSNLFKANWVKVDKSINPNYYASFDEGYFELYNQDGNEKEMFLKMFPTLNDNVRVSKITAGSGTGFAISKDGLITTNNHVVEGAEQILVLGINNDFSKKYKAKLVVADTKNDLAIIQITDSSFTSFDAIPFTIKNQTSDVGTSVNVLGYPLRATMGDEIKLTNGLISSKTGYKGDITSYQISAPVQPGNSGGPLFDVDGNVIGIVNAKHGGAENVSYAVKSNYLINLFDLLPKSPKFPETSALVGKPLPNQIAILKKYIVIVEVK